MGHDGSGCRDAQCHLVRLVSVAIHSELYRRTISFWKDIGDMEVSLGLCFEYVVDEQLARLVANK
jgi:hypothetical protein